MIAVGLAVLIGIVVWAAAQAAGRRHAPGGAPPGPGEPPRDTARLLARWTDAGLLTAAEAAARVAWERAAAADRPVPTRVAGRSSGVPVVAEALGYLGGALGVAGLGLVVAHYWPDVPTAGRVALAAAVAALLLAGGALVRERADPALARLRWFLWLGSAGAAGMAAGVLVADGLDGPPEAVAAAAGLAVAALCGPLWWGRVRPLQQVGALAGLAVALGAGSAWLVDAGPAGLAVLALGAGYLAAGLRTTRPVAAVTVAVGAITAVAGTAVAGVRWTGPGLVLGALTGLGLLAVAAVPGAAPRRADQRATAVVGAIALLQAAPTTVGYFAFELSHAAVTGVLVWLVGAALLAVGGRRLVRVPEVAEVLGAVAMLGGAAVTVDQWGAAAPILGALTAAGLVALGALPDRVVLSLLGAVGLLVNVPWAIARLFPGEDRAPLLILAAGVVLVVVAVLLARGRPRGLPARRAGPPPRQAGP
ncbi:MAG TPA: DUF2157 domain-containing protein [Acidimicrobiales bacterium]